MAADRHRKSCGWQGESIRESWRGLEDTLAVHKNLYRFRLLAGSGHGVPGQMDWGKVNFAIGGLADDNRAWSLAHGLLGYADVSLAGDVDVHRGLEPAPRDVMCYSGNSVGTGVFSGQ